MPLEKAKALWGKHRPIIEAAFWILAFAAAFILMQKVMHPERTFFGI